MITAADFIHPEDAAAMAQLENITGFPTFVKKILELGLEKMQYGINMASAIRLAGGPASITKDINLEEWAKQADTYEEIRTDGLWNKALQVYAIANQTHPFSAVRVREVLKWSKTEQYRKIMEHLRAGSSSSRCRECGNFVSDSWEYCRHCGTKLK